MSGNRITIAKDAISQFIDTMYSHDRVSIIGYDSSAKVFSNFTDNKESLKSSLYSIYASGGTSVEAGLSRIPDTVWQIELVTLL